MAKIDSVNKYKEEYLSGKSQAQRDRFEAKDVDHQYQSIMTWRYNKRRRSAAKTAETPVEASVELTAVEVLRELRDKLAARTTLTEEEINEVMQELDVFKEQMRMSLQRCRREEIRRLESRQEEINARLRTLREQTAQDSSGMPSLFD